MNNGNLPAALPWWRFGHVWLVISGPAIVVIAGFVTLYIALTMPDPVVADDYYRQGIDINKTLAATDASLAPAILARNHAATGAVPVASSAPKP